MIRTLALIGLGSCAGGVARYLLSRWLQNAVAWSFPLGTLTVNVLGCLAIGILYGVFERGGLGSPGLRLMLTAGFCGGFTTFSTFALENIAMMRAAEMLPAALYTALSLVAGFAAVWAGGWLVRMW